MVKCPNCGKEITNGKFCGNCGTPIPEASINSINDNLSNNENNSEFCGNCGAKLKPGAKFCPSCGSPVVGSLNQDLSNTNSFDNINYSFGDTDSNINNNLNNGFDINNSKFDVNNTTNPNLNKFDTTNNVHSGFDTNTPNVSNKSLTLALILSFFIPGTGFMYLGKFKKGFVILIICALFSVTIFNPLGAFIWFICYAYNLYGVYKYYNENFTYFCFISCL
ncbi:hypothetical protein BGI41_02760 [Methanobrevibacter sp. 87.7]|uniref:zinc ribbon domain-containing protein n=1 Tax=Methanobrevibacter sp. 87.7 TaxID=387957 RepID=UPI000B6A18C4|nr:zinc ribbon domain-containing protein [Methanobrevibacter sp. 87.7]OWT33381.1 hypothetical protein BGI41_02760 [Methanobrevibacter sp. 87.7]